MTGVFIQVNTKSRYARCKPIGYVVQKGGCWEWTGYRDGNGYGRVRGTLYNWHVYAHRWMYEKEVGPIPMGMECHHICGNKWCVNPAHLETVTHKEHVARDKGWGHTKARRNRGGDE